MTDTANLNLPQMTESQGTKYLTHNEALWILDALCQGRVIDRDLTAPPGGESEGDVYIPAAGASGDWSGWDNKIAYYVDSSWNVITPLVGWMLWIVDEGVRVVWDGSAWSLIDYSLAQRTRSFVVSVSDESTALETSTEATTFRMPHGFTLTGIRASLTTAPTGADLIVDVNKDGGTILSTKLSIDATEKTSTTAATPPVISDSSLGDDSEITIDIDQIGSGTAGAGLKITFIGVTNVATQNFVLAAGYEDAALETGAGKVTFRMPYGFTLAAVRASVNTAPTGSTIIVDINEGGVSLLSTKLTIDASEKTSLTAAVAAVISDADLADDAEITVDIDQIGSGTAGAGLKIVLIGVPT